MTNQIIINQIQKVMDVAVKNSNAYYFTPGKSAADRRWRESQNNISVFSFTEGKDTWELGYNYRETCGNVYAKGHYIRNGNKTTLLAVRGLLKRAIASNGASIKEIGDCDA